MAPTVEETTKGYEERYQTMDSNQLSSVTKGLKTFHIKKNPLQICHDHLCENKNFYLVTFPDQLQLFYQSLF